MDKMKTPQNTVGYIDNRSLKSVPNAGKEKFIHMNQQNIVKEVKSSDAG
jgi:hypothetical protein